MKEIYIAAPANAFTGGPTLAHQLCYNLNENGFKAYMYYYHPVKSEQLIHERYEHFHNPFVTKVPNDSNTILVVPETGPDYLKHHKKCKKIVWWMSVDNYFDVYLKGRRNKYANIMGILKFNVFQNGIVHFVQSHYAEEFLLSKNVSQESIFSLSDYVDDIFMKSYKENFKTQIRDNIILYSPKRGLEFTKKLINRLSDYECIPLIGMTQDEMVEYMKKSKLYIDFGNHPGKDRIPREAAISGCCIITGMRGSAKNDYDVKIPLKYKFNEDDADIDNICSRISYIMHNYDEAIDDFRSYRDMIANEKKIFIDNGIEIFTKLTSD